MASCSNCGGSRDRANQRYCRACHAEYQRIFRPKHSELSDEQRRKANCRAYANVYQRRGTLVPRACAVCCREDGVQMHHPDYSKPLEVVWMCAMCHRLLHRIERLP